MTKIQKEQTPPEIQEDTGHGIPDEITNETSDIAQQMLKTFFKGDEIYQYADSVSQDYKEFKEEVVHHLNFLKKQCDEGMEKKNIMALNGINNYITSFLIRNHLIDYKDEDFKIT